MIYWNVVKTESTYLLECDHDNVVKTEWNNLLECDHDDVDDGDVVDRPTDQLGLVELRPGLPDVVADANAPK